MVIGSKVFAICLQEFWLLQIAYICGLLQCVIAGLAPSTAILFLGKHIHLILARFEPAIYFQFSYIYMGREPNWDIRGAVMH